MSEGEKAVFWFERARRYREAICGAYDLVTVDEGLSAEEIVQRIREDLHDALGDQ